MKGPKRPRRRGVPRRRPLRSADPRHRRTPRGRQGRARRRRWRARSTRSSRGIAPARPPIVARTTSPGSKTRRRPWTRSTASPRSISTRAASRARGRALVFYVNREKTDGHPAARGQRAVVRRPHAVGSRSIASRASPASPPTRSTSWSRPATRVRSRRSASTCRTTRSFARRTAASRSRSRTSTRPTTSRQVPGMRSEFSWTPEEVRARREVGHPGGRAHDEHARGRSATRRASSPTALNGKPEAFLKEHYSALEEGRADLVGLYFIADPKTRRARPRCRRPIRRRSCVPSTKGYTRNALVQLRRVRDRHPDRSSRTCAIAR